MMFIEDKQEALRTLIVLPLFGFAFWHTAPAEDFGDIVMFLLALLGIRHLAFMIQEIFLPYKE